MRLSRPLIVAKLVGLLLLSLHLVGCGDDGGDAPSAPPADVPEAPPDDL